MVDTHTNTCTHSTHTPTPTRTHTHSVRAGQANKISLCAAKRQRRAGTGAGNGKGKGTAKANSIWAVKNLTNIGSLRVFVCVGTGRGGGGCYRRAQSIENINEIDSQHARWPLVRRWFTSHPVTRPTPSHAPRRTATHCAGLAPCCLWSCTSLSWAEGVQV